MNTPHLQPFACDLGYCNVCESACALDWILWIPPSNRFSPCAAAAARELPIRMYQHASHRATLAYLGNVTHPNGISSSTQGAGFRGRKQYLWLARHGPVENGSRRVHSLHVSLSITPPPYRQDTYRRTTSGSHAMSGRMVGPNKS